MEFLRFEGALSGLFGELLCVFGDFRDALPVGVEDDGSDEPGIGADGDGAVAVLVPCGLELLMSLIK